MDMSKIAIKSPKGTDMSTTVKATKLPVIPHEIIHELDQTLARLHELFEPYGTVLSVYERKNLSRMGVKNTGFVERACQFSVSNPEFVAAYTKPGEFEANLEASKELLPIRAKVKTLYEVINDTFILAGAKAFKFARSYYGNTQNASKDNVPNANPIREDLEKRYNQTRRKNKTESGDIQANTGEVNVSGTDQEGSLN
jgi:hypothetical protein